MTDNVAMDHNVLSIPPRQFEIQNWLLGRGRVVESTSDHGKSGGRVGCRKSSRGGKLARGLRKERPPWHSVDLSHGHQKDDHDRRHTWAHHLAVGEKAAEGGMRDGDSNRPDQTQKRISPLLDVPLQMLGLGRDSSYTSRSGDGLPSNSSSSPSSPLLTPTTSKFPSTTNSNRSSTLSSASTSTSSTIFSSTSTIPFLPLSTCPSTSVVQLFPVHSWPLTTILDPSSTALPESEPLSFVQCSNTTMRDPHDTTEASGISMMSRPLGNFFSPSRHQFTHHLEPQGFLH